jgi:hypothetical protein
MNATTLFLTDARTQDVTKARIRRAFRLGLIQPGTVADLQIAHDDDCPALRGSACACVPDLTVTASDGQRWVDVGRDWELVS